MPRRALTLACAPYDRTLPLFDGRVRAEGLDLNVILLRYEDTFWRQLRHQEFDASEMSLSSYFIAKERGPDLIAIPVFLSRVFRHSSIYVNANAGIKTDCCQQKDVTNIVPGKPHLLQHGKNKHEQQEAPGVPAVHPLQHRQKLSTCLGSHYSSSPSSTPYSLSSLFM